LAGAAERTVRRHRAAWLAGLPPQENARSDRMNASIAGSKVAFSSTGLTRFEPDLADLSAASSGMPSDFHHRIRKQAQAHGEPG